MGRLLLGLVASIGLHVSSDAGAAEPVDVALVLAVDTSLSMSPEELEIQRRGYAAALTDPSVIEAIRSGLHGRIAVTYFEWAGNTSRSVVVPWTVIAGPADARAVADRLARETPATARRTSISGALEFGADLLAEASFPAGKRVIDISGDGPNNQGAPVEGARDAVVAQGIVVNGLPLMTRGGFGGAFDVERLDRYYADCVIGGPGAFVVPVEDWSQFPEAVRRKLVLELASAPPSGGPPSVVLARAEPKTDCLIGEKIWRDRYRAWPPPP